LGAILLFALAALWIAWFAVARHRLNSRLVSLQAAGETLDPSQLVFRPPPTTLPAGRFFHQALAAMSTTQPTPSFTPSGVETPPFSDKWHDLAEQAIRANASALAFARRARGFQESPWAFNDFNPARALSALLGDAAIHAHHTGDDAEALDRILDARHLVWCMYRDPATLPPIVAIAIDAEADFALFVVIAAPTTPAVRNPLATSPTRRKTLESLVPELLDDTPLRTRIIFNLRQEMIYEYQVLDTNIHGMTLLRPAAEIDTAAVLDNRMRILDAVQQPDYPTALTRLSPQDSFDLPPVQRLPPRYAHLIHESFPNHTTMVQLQFQLIAQARLLATDIAAQLYFTDRHHFPASLADLVPNYLPAVPSDPFSPKGDPIVYLTITSNGARRPRLAYRNLAGVLPAAPPPDAPFNYAPYNSDNSWVDLTIPASQPAVPPTSSLQPSLPYDPRKLTTPIHTNPTTAGNTASPITAPTTRLPGNPAAPANRPFPTPPCVAFIYILTGDHHAITPVAAIAPHVTTANTIHPSFAISRSSLPPNAQ
jgi:hypothetical protein